MSNTVKANAYPAKRFFVEMLTRDIELQDSILDLLDNCVDGAMRSVNGQSKTSKPYKGCVAWIDLANDHFQILDNCGGIPLDLAQTYAFRLGRPDPQRDKNLPTVGVYGIGMKRAVFKMGRNIQIHSRTKNEGFIVNISPGWLESDTNWELPVELNNEALDRPGTLIRVEELRDGIPRLFGNETGFVDKLKTAISAYYSFIMEKGFEVWINGEKLGPIHNNLIFDDKNGAGIAPFLYQAKIGEVSVELTVGLYRPLPKDEEDEQALDGRPSSEHAGWTIVCNDRVVLYADKTRATGWGEATVPQYHTQFISIAGTVIFKSNDASKLPLTTTKRGIDGNSELYLAVKEYMREGLKHFTDFTNKWKKSTKELSQLNSSSPTVRTESVSALVPQDKWTTVSRGVGGKRFKPNLPLPKDDDPNRIIKFSRPASEIAEVAEMLFDDPDRSPMDVGMKCFDDALKRARK
jgi:hypothetical protein